MSILLYDGLGGRFLAGANVSQGQVQDSILDKGRIIRVSDHANAPASFERMMDRVLIVLTWRICLVYMDDIIVGGPTVEVTVKRIMKVFERLREAHLTLKPSKCDLFQPSVTFLGHVIDKDGFHTDPKMISAVACRGEPRMNE
jgi:hypothetical protein